MARAFLDTNVLLRHLLQDVPNQSAAATRFLQSVEDGTLEVRMADTVLFETVFTLDRHYRQPRPEIRDALLPLLELRGIVFPGKRSLRRVFELYVDVGLPFADAYHAVLMQRLGLTEIVSFDRDFDRIPGIRRIGP